MIVRNDGYLIFTEIKHSICTLFRAGNALVSLLIVSSGARGLNFCTGI